jgi:cytoskeletal protein CcmA (bactofilin family)/predicted anti-sigma-YlaC factor YlaD
MSCHPELSYAIYVDGELTPEQARPVEAHLIGCRRCRELVVALREEAGLFADALQEQASLARPASPLPTEARRAARGLAIGAGPVLAAAAVAIVASGWILDTMRPAALGWLDAWSLRGAYDMAFDLIFLLRDEAPAAFEVALAVAAMASASALLTFALTALLRHWSGPGALSLLALAAVLTPAAPGHAHFGLHQHPDFSLAAGETHEGTLVASGHSVNVDGVVTGDLFVLAQRLTIRGEVRGNLVALARNLELPGRVTGSVHVAASRANVSGTVAGNLYALAEDLALASRGRIERDAAFAGESAVFEGAVGRDLFVAGDWLEVRGSVGRDLRAWGEHLTLLDGAQVGGDVDARLPSGTEVDVTSGARIQGEIRTREPEHHGPRGFARFLEGRFFLWLALHIAAGFAVGMLLHAVLPGIFAGRLETGRAFFRSLGVGFLVVVAGPIAIAAVALTLVGIPVAVMGLGLYLSALYVAGILVAALIGVALTHPRGEGWTSFGLALLVGLVILVLAMHTPVLGGVVRAVAVLTGVGLLADRARIAWSALRRAAA